MNLKEATARRPLWSVTHANLSLDYPLIRLVDEDVDDFQAMEAGEQLDEENWAIAGEVWLCLLSTGTGHTPVITMEAWEEAPASSGPGTSDCEQELVATFPSGTLWLSGGTDGGNCRAAHGGA